MLGCRGCWMMLRSGGVGGAWLIVLAVAWAADAQVPYPNSTQFQVNTYTTGYQEYASVASDASGNFVVVWESEGSPGGDTSSFSIQGRRYTSTGTPIGSQFQVNTYTTGYQLSP